MTKITIKKRDKEFTATSSHEFLLSVFPLMFNTNIQIALDIMSMIQIQM